MRKKLLVILAVVVVLAVVVAAPVSAEKPAPTLRGDQLMVLNQDPVTGEFGLYGCEEISWFGSIDIKGTTYGMALYPLPGRTTGTVLHYEEGWKVWTDEFTLTDGVLDTCEPGEYLLSGTDTGAGSFKNGTFRSNGTVDEASIEAIVRAAGLELRYVPEAVVRNKGPETVADLVRQRRRITAGHSRYAY